MGLTPTEHRHWWVPRRIQALRIMWHQGVSTTVIADTLGTTRNAVVGKARRLGLPERKDGQPRPSNTTASRWERAK